MPSPLRTPDPLDQEAWTLPSPALPTHSFTDAERSDLGSDVPFTQLLPDPMASFEQRLASTKMPPPGPDYFCVRRAMWREPTIHSPRTDEASTSRKKLEDLLNQKGVEEDDEAWKAGLGKVYKSLVGGARLKRRLPLNIVVRIVLSGWIRDGTWPRGGIAPEPDDELSVVAEDTEYLAPTISTTATPDTLSRAISPWSPLDLDTYRDPWARRAT